MQWKSATVWILQLFLLGKGWNNQRKRDNTRIQKNFMYVTKKVQDWTSEEASFKNWSPKSYILILLAEGPVSIASFYDFFPTYINAL